MSSLTETRVNTTKCKLAFSFQDLVRTSGYCCFISKRDDLFLLAYILEEFGSASECYSLDGFSGFAQVLVMDAQIGAMRLDRHGEILRISRKMRHCADLTKKKK